MDGDASPSIGERAPLLPTTETRPRGPRTVTFSANPVTRTIEPEPRLTHSRSSNAVHGVATNPPMLAALNSKLRRRNSQGAVPLLSAAPFGAKLGPQRSTKKTEKLKLLPNPEVDEDEDEESGRDVYSQYTRIKDPTARRHAARLGKGDRDLLPRVTAYCTANRYDMDNLMRFLKGRGKSRGANPKLIDECIYTPFSYGKEQPTQPKAWSETPPDNQARPDPVQRYQRRHSTGGDAVDDESLRETQAAYQQERHDSGYVEEFATVEPGDLLTGEDLLGPGVGDELPISDNIPDFDTKVHTPEVFLFDYGVVVIWGMTEAEETRFLKYISKFELEKLAPDDVETEHFNFYYTREYQARIYNDFITLRDKNNYMIKLAISHALAQSVKVGKVSSLTNNLHQTNHY